MYMNIICEANNNSDASMIQDCGFSRNASEITLYIKPQ